ncbi:polyprenyl synthetase family protein, partial [Prevotella sp.]|uniref:polyprenyl synthetase family protein n=1 Tax=Prevotella sp. TaxID=59823 RepID=UPI002647B6B6
NALDDYALYMGLTFQITDDILDVVGDSHVLGKPVGSDEKNKKATYSYIKSLPLRPNNIVK